MSMVTPSEMMRIIFESMRELREELYKEWDKLPQEEKDVWKGIYDVQETIKINLEDSTDDI